MFTYNPTIAPAARQHLDAQTAFVNDVSKSLSTSFQNVCQLNFQLMTTLFQETMQASQRLLAVQRPADGAVTLQPAAEKLRTYQQDISRLLADANVELARLTERHGKETSMTANALAQQVARMAQEGAAPQAPQGDAGKGAMDQFRDKATQGAERATAFQREAQGASRDMGTLSRAVADGGKPAISG